MEYSKTEIPRLPTEEEQLTMAGEVADWFVPFLYGVEIEIGEVPLIVQARLGTVVGAHDIAQQLVLVRELVNTLPAEHKNNAVLYCTGYPQRALSVLGDGDINVTTELMMVAGEQYRAQQPDRRRAVVPYDDMEYPTESDIEDIYVPKDRSSRSHEMRKDFAEAGISDEQIMRRLNGYVASTDVRSQAATLRAAVRFMKWYRGDQTEREFAESEGVSLIGVRKSIERLTAVVLDEAFDREYELNDIVGGAMEKPVESARYLRPATKRVNSFEDTEWQKDALCAQTDPEAFFPEKGGSTRDAKKICASCDVRANCLEYALGNGELFGIWGGLSERERRMFRKRA